MTRDKRRNKPSILLFSLVAACVCVAALAQDHARSDQQHRGPVAAISDGGTEKSTAFSPRNILKQNHHHHVEEIQRISVPVPEQHKRQEDDKADQSFTDEKRTEHRVHHHHHHHVTPRNSGKRVFQKGGQFHGEEALPLIDSEPTRQLEQSEESHFQSSLNTDQGTKHGPTEWEPFLAEKDTEQLQIRQLDETEEEYEDSDGEEDGDDEDEDAQEEDVDPADDDDDDLESEDGDHADAAPAAPVKAPAPTPAPAPAAGPTPKPHGLVPSVIGAHHCTPEFCVNVSVSNDGQFATFHIERDREETGWISLGIGYAMTVSDLLVFWPNPKAGPHGVTFSRRNTHAYLEPRDTSAMAVEDAAVRPVSEYMIHNTHMSSNTPVSAAGANNKDNNKKLPFDASKKFIVQFTRPLKVRHREYDLHPGRSQDFCWAFSPNPILPAEVANPAAHLQQHLTVGSFALDVGAGQPKLKDLFAKMQQKDKAEEEERKKQGLLQQQQQQKQQQQKQKEMEHDKNGRHGVSKHHGDTGDEGQRHRAKTSLASSTTIACWKRCQGFGLVQSSSFGVLAAVFLAKIIAALL
ncbi:hypothetical protein BGZ73_004998 [Actinomortierella ambigua]|nr:hypothetical protein BGZ73_004998 [Actinomortierella ambigua]